MRKTPRTLASRLEHAARGFSVVIVTGPRRAGKTTLLRMLRPTADYVLLEDPDTIARVRADPRHFIDSLKPPAILDEIQNAPELLSYLRTRVDATPSRKGQWFLTGSQEAPLMRGVTESMAGRAAIFQLLPFSLAEAPKVSMLKGGFPEVLVRPSGARDWFRSYVQTYLERDVRSITAVRDLATFRRFLALVATRCGQMLNRSELAAPLGVSVPTISDWVGILETTGQLIVVPPFYENFGKRLVKSPKLYWGDTGLLCHLLGIDTVSALDRSPFLGPVFENFVATEIVKHQIHSGAARSLYYFRDQQGLEIDFVVPGKAREIVLIEAKATKTPRPEHRAPLSRFAKAVHGYAMQQLVVHRGKSVPSRSASLGNDVRAVTVQELRSYL